MSGQILSGPRCGGPEVCGKPQSWHRPSAQARPWGFHDVQCQVPSANPKQYPGCGFTDGHESGHSYSWRIGTPERQAYEVSLRQRAKPEPEAGS
jgi:hypothetical protein